MNKELLLPTTRRNKYSVEDVKMFLNQQHCQDCGTTKFLTKDHIIPVSLGGLDGIANYQILCYGCNVLKNAKILVEYTTGVYVNDLYAVFIDSFGTNIPKIYLKEVFKSCIYLDNMTRNCTDIQNSIKIVEYAKAYGLYNTYPFRRDIKYLPKRYIPKQHKYVVEFEPKFNVSKEALLSYFNKRG